MFFVRFVLLAFLAAYSYSMGQTAASGLNGFGKFISLTFFLAAPALYLLPIYEAWKKKHPNLTAIALVNIFLGWSLIGWVIAVVWAHKKPEPVMLTPTTVGTTTAPTASTVSAAPVRATKKCPFCAEDILVQAVKCKHCGSDLRATA